ncbi:acetyl-coenzyme A synthetase N-terminal domain-containing protein, partial [Mesorhizobium sp. M7A.F.Ca.ET.027.03.2.1]
MAAGQPLWTPTQDQIDAAPLTAFTKAAGVKAGVAFSSYSQLHAWSVEDREGFWSLIWDFCGIVGDKGDNLLVDGDKMPGASFFPDATLNFAENLLKKTGSGDAIVFRGEDKVERRLSWN